MVSYPTVKKVWGYDYLFWQNSRTWQTDRQTDRRTVIARRHKSRQNIGNFAGNSSIRTNLYRPRILRDVYVDELIVADFFKNELTVYMRTWCCWAGVNGFTAEMARCVDFYRMTRKLSFETSSSRWRQTDWERSASLTRSSLPVRQQIAELLTWTIN